ncbi:Ureide permease 2-like protein [Drosera capensis]
MRNRLFPNIRSVNFKRASASDLWVRCEQNSSALFLLELGDDSVHLVLVLGSEMQEALQGSLKMYVVESKAGAIGCMLLSLFLLGTFPAVMTSLERRGRLPQHTFLDYSITNFLAAVLIAFTFGQIGDAKPGEPNFLTQLGQDNWPSVLLAMAGGVFLSVGNLATQYAWAFVGLSVAEVTAASTTLNYFLYDEINKAQILFPGVACFLVAVLLGAAVHESNSADNKTKLESAAVDKERGDGTGIKVGGDVGTADFLIDLENRRTIKHMDRASLEFFCWSMLLTLLASVQLSNQRSVAPVEGGVDHLVVYTAFFYFSCSCFAIAIVLNISFLYYPVLNLPKSSLKAYLNDWDGRGVAFLAGIICGLGNGLQFMGGEAAGYAAADAVQALPLVSTFWGIVLYGEYQKSSRKTYALLALPLVSTFWGIVLYGEYQKSSRKTYA